MRTGVCRTESVKHEKNQVHLFHICVFLCDDHGEFRGAVQLQLDQYPEFSAECGADPDEIRELAARPEVQGDRD